MHDVLAHRLSLLAAAAGAMEYRPDAPPERLSAAAGVIRASAHHALDELREVITLLRSDDAESPTDAPPGQTLADLPRLVDEARAAGQQIEVDDPLGPPVEIPPTVGRTAYRIAQEALTNARKHAAGQPVRLVLGGAPGAGLSIAVSNPTTPDSGATGSAGTGLIGLAERAALTGGRRRPTTSTPRVGSTSPRGCHGRRDRPIRVVIVDDDPLVRGMLTLMLDGADGIVVVGEAADGATAITAVDGTCPTWC